KTTGNPFDTIGQKEFYKSIEFRWYPTTKDRWRWDQVRLQFWHQDAIKSKGTPSSHGATFAASKLLRDKWYPFLLAGWSDGNATIFKTDVIAGLGVGFDTRHRVARDVLGVAVGWGNPSNDLLQDQTTAELFYRFQLVEHVALTPSVQYVRNPAANPNLNDALVFGLRARITY
ncbi:carbohydrate porin, partial [uncultured Ruegeria sp.]|uniref:carbohydrate porin n=1 Tax=uncultured Ruegeria sp. TaxID=259304 RepID=UPI002636E472